ncbi:MAG: nuclear transport factor 2 family protein [Lysobacteraceae bacterium]
MLLTAGLLLACLAACSTAPPEQRLRERIASMQAAIEAGESGGFMDGVADDFVGEGGMDRRQLRGLIAAQLLRAKEVGVSVVSMEVRMLAGDRQAEVELDVLLTGGAGLLPDRASTYGIRTGWCDGDDGWQVISADWDRGL